MTQKLKLLQLCAVDFTAYHFLLPLARSLRESYDVEFASSPGPYVEPIRQEGFRYHTLDIERSYDVLAHTRALFKLRGLFSRERYAIVHTHTPIASLIGRVAARWASVPIALYTAHGYYFHERMRPRKRRFFEGLERFGGRFTDFIFTQSAEDGEATVRLGFAESDCVMHIGNGVDLVRFDPERLRPSRSTWRRTIGVGDDQLVVCTVGRLVREKGYLELLRAFALLAKRVPRAVLVAVGGALDSDHDNASDEIRGLAESLGIQDRVRFLSFQREVEGVLSASDIFVLASHREGMPRSLLEAMAMGLPVVATNIRGSREAVSDGVTGRLLEVGDVGGLSAALEELLGDPELRQQYGLAALQKARREFDEQVVIAKQAAVIERLCIEKGLRSG